MTGGSDLVVPEGIVEINRFILDKGGALTLGQLYVTFTTIAALIGFKGLSDAIKKQERGGVLPE